MNTSKDGLSLIRKSAVGFLWAFVVISAAAQPAPPGRIPVRRFDFVASPGQSSTSELTNAPSNYVVRIEWSDKNNPSGAIEVLTGEGTFQLNSSFPAAAKSGEPTLLTSATVNGSLKVLNENQGRLELFLGRSIPYSTTGPGQSSSIQQRQEGLTVTFYVTFGKSVTAQKDAKGEVTVLVKKQAP